MQRKPRVSLSDVAREAGVSRMTVSLALRDDGQLPVETRQRIQELARRIGYHANPRLSRVMAETARTRYGDEKGALVFLTTEPTGEDNAGDGGQSFTAAKVRAEDHGYQLSHYWITDPTVPPARANNILWNRGVEGLIIPHISSYLYALGQHSLPIDWDKFSVVEIGDSMLEPVVNRVRHNHFGAMLKALHKLEVLGYRRIGLCLLSDNDLRTHHRWSAAFLLWRAMRPQASTLEPLLLKEVDPQLIVKWVHKYKVDAVVSPGCTVLHALREGGLAVPENVGFATLHAWGTHGEAVAGIDQGYPLLASSAVDMLVSLVNRQSRGIPKQPIEWLSIGTWVDGTTTKLIPQSVPLPSVETQSLIFETAL